MSDSDKDTLQLSKLTKKLAKCNETVNMILELLKLIDKKVEPKTDQKEIDEIFKKKQIGRPKGDYETKRKQYLEMLNENKIKEPKASTLEFYKIQKEDDKYVIMI